MILQTNFLLLIVLLVNSSLLSFEFAEFLIERKLILEQMIFFKQRVCQILESIFGCGAHVFAIKGTYVVYIVIVTYHVMHMLKGPPTLHLKKFPRRITLALGRKKRKKRKRKN